MEFEKIIIETKRTFKFILSRLKEVFTLPFAKTYIFLSIILILVFTIINFPYEPIIIEKLKKTSKNFSREFEIENFDFSLFGNSSAEKISILTKKRNKISIFDVVLSPKSNLISQYLFGTDFNKISIRNIKFSNNEYTVSLKLNSEIDMDLNLKNIYSSEGEITTSIKNINFKIIEIKLPQKMGGIVLSNKEIKRSSIISNFSLIKQKLSIKNFQITGKDLNGSISGSIKLNKNISNSRLRLRVKINSDSLFISEYKPFIPSGYIHEDGYIHLKISGTLSKPKIQKN